LFEGAPSHFSATPPALQILAAMNIIARFSFSIRKPVHLSLLDALNQFSEQGYVDKLKLHITSESLPSDKEALIAFLYDLIINI